MRFKSHFCHFLAVWLGKAPNHLYHLKMGITVPTLQVFCEDERGTECLW